MPAVHVDGRTLVLSAIQRLNPKVGYIAGWTGTDLGLAKTTDGGATWKTVANSASQQAFVVDRQWQASDPALGRHYLTVHDGTANIQTSVSTDDGYQYVQNREADAADGQG